MCENLSVRDSFMETSLLRTPLYCKYPYLWYGHVFITDTSQSPLQTPINCTHLWYGDVFIMDTSHIYLSITDSIMDTFVVQTSPN